MFHPLDARPFFVEAGRPYERSGSTPITANVSSARQVETDSRLRQLNQSLSDLLVTGRGVPVRVEEEALARLQLAVLIHAFHGRSANAD